MSILGPLLWFVISLGLLVTFHEFGHYWVARRNGVKVLRFSVGFGRALWSRRGRDGTEYRIAAIPLGGYVKMLDEREGDVDPAEVEQAFNRKSVWRRIAIVAAGPAANLILCLILLWAMFVIGRPGYAPVIGQVQGLAEASGLRVGDTVLTVDGRATPIWEEVGMALLPAALDRRDAVLHVRDAEGELHTRTLQLSKIPAGVDELHVMPAIGVTARAALIPPLVGKVAEGSAAWGVLAEGDLLLAIDGQPVRTFEDIGPLVAALGRDAEVMVEVQRDGERRALPIRPRQSHDDGPSRLILGVGPVQNREPPPTDAVQRYGPLEAVPVAVREMGYQVKQLGDMIGRVFTQRISLRNSVSGPVTIARAADSYAQMGPAWYLTILAMLSLSIGLLNLLPIPVLDGGHLLYYLIELVKGSPLSERAMAAGQYVGLALLAGLMGLAFYNDILNNFVR